MDPVDANDASEVSGASDAANTEAAAVVAEDAAMDTVTPSAEKSDGELPSAPVLAPESEPPPEEKTDANPSPPPADTGVSETTTELDAASTDASKDASTDATTADKSDEKVPDEKVPDDDAMMGGEEAVERPYIGAEPDRSTRDAGDANESSFDDSNAEEGASSPKTADQTELDNEPEILEITANDINHEGESEEVEENDEEMDAEDEVKEETEGNGRKNSVASEEKMDVDGDGDAEGDGEGEGDAEGDGDGDLQDFGVTTDKPLFEHVNTEKVLDKSADSDSQDSFEDEAFRNSQPQEDPIAADTFTNVTDPAAIDEQDTEEQGADAEICIIPDTGSVVISPEPDKESESAVPSASNDADSIAKEVEGRYLISACNDETPHNCLQCNTSNKAKYICMNENMASYICTEKCLGSLKEKHGDKVIISSEVGDVRVKKLLSNMLSDNMIGKIHFTRSCAECRKKMEESPLILAWETMEFCNELCLSKYQKRMGSVCTNCNLGVRTNCLGKYCVRFGNDIRQFCSSVCLENYKKALRVCNFCQKDITKTNEWVLAPTDNKDSFRDFCAQGCMEKYNTLNANKNQTYDPATKCSVCNLEKPIEIDFQHNKIKNYFCGDPCFIAFKFVNNITPGKCNMCSKYTKKKVLEENCMYLDGKCYSFCCKICQNSYIVTHRKIVPCSWCKVKKYNFDMIKRQCVNGQVVLMCSLNCLSLYRVSVTAVNSKKIDCDNCNKSEQPMYHLTMSDATIRNFCSYGCVLSFQNQFAKAPITLEGINKETSPVPTGAPKRTRKYITKVKELAPLPDLPNVPVISNVHSLAMNGPSNGPRLNKINLVNSNNLSAPVVVPSTLPLPANSLTTAGSTTSITAPITTTPAIAAAVVATPLPPPPPPPTTATITTSTTQDATANKGPMRMQVIVRPLPVPPQRNKGVSCRVICNNKGINCVPKKKDASCQTDEVPEKTAVIPIPVPIYVPMPAAMYSLPFPVPFPFPLPIPVPLFIPTTRNSANGIMKEIKKIQVKIPSDPFEAELLMMAEMVADDKKEDNTESDTDEEDNQATAADEGSFSPEPTDASNTFGDDMLQMALKMATELDEPAVDLEGALTANTITAAQVGENTGTEGRVETGATMDNLIDRQDQVQTQTRRRKRTDRSPRNTSKRGRRSSHVEIPVIPAPQPPPPSEPVEKPDANMCLKYTFGVNAWKQWVTTKNAELEKTSRRPKLFKTDLLQLTADELNYSLCLFVKEVRKPNGQEYAPDTIYYLCLGIQQHLFESGRIDNIFCDAYYEKFTDCLDEVARRFSVLYNDSHYIVTRVEEEHLWESKQLGAHSPHVLLSTLMFFNTKHFNLTSVDEHMQLSFSHIMKHWKRNPGQAGGNKAPPSRNVLLRFYPPQTTTENSVRKKKVYEQQENEDNPLRCPVKLYEFYLSKCPESVKTRNDVFYLMPERSCVPDSPVWYSTMALPKAALEKMLHRVKMVKEINVALLTS